MATGMRLCAETSILGIVHETVALLSLIEMATGMRFCNATYILGSVHVTVTLFYNLDGNRHEAV
jgi:NADH:ubiquinone oxidoreductase subunit D